ncbi:MAG TPA: CFI-box-CTERM domain-containing protein [Gammaproteobacteria bacterium]|nr:CFI-box-CTERM domain-containing protein [Gammaproteobacteria bacterium]
MSSADDARTGASRPLIHVLVLCTAALAARADELVVPTAYPDIQDAINNAHVGDRVLIEPGEYQENIRARSQVDVRGRETGRVILTPRNGAAPIVSFTNVQGVLLSNITFTGVDVAVEVRDSLGVTIANNVFESIVGTALRTDAASSVQVSNNVFESSGTAIERGSAATRVTNNIFAGNRRALSAPNDNADSGPNVSFNCFFGNADPLAGQGTSVQLGDPAFVDTARRDFHLQQKSACLDAGTGTDVIDSSVADMGAYGGGLADTAPFPVPKPDARVDASGKAIVLGWQPNLSYHVSNSANPGGYRVHYSLNTGGPPFDGQDADSGTKPSPIDVGNTGTFTLEDLAPSVETPLPPRLLSVEPRDGGAVLEWSAVERTTGYRVLYGVDAPAEQSLDAGTATNATVVGLVNGTTYRFAVTARAQATYYLAVTVYDNTPSRHESAFSETATAGVGPVAESGASNALTAIPGPTVPVPNLPDEGCFIATAAYGADWVAEVTILRDFRDRYLLPYRLGRLVTHEYYVVGKPMARYIYERPYLKRPVRVLLTPLVFVGLTMLASSPVEKAALTLLVAGLLPLHGFTSRRRRAAGMPA